VTAPTNIREAGEADEFISCPDCGGATYWFGYARDWACRHCQKVCHRDDGPAFLAAEVRGPHAAYATIARAKSTPVLEAVR
jgi:tRNA(Ile2) C34 agmatinyltransferase TiaS